MKVAVILAAALALPLGGCITASVVRDLSPEAKRELALKFLERCGGTVNIGGSGAAGQLGGAASADFRITGTCPVPSEAKPVEAGS